MSNDTIHNIALDALITKELDLQEKLDQTIGAIAALKESGATTDSCKHRIASKERLRVNLSRAITSLENTMALLERDRVAETIEGKLQVALEAKGFTTTRIAVASSAPIGDKPGSVQIGGIIYVNQFTTLRTSQTYDVHGNVETIVTIHGPSDSIEKPAKTIPAFPAHKDCIRDVVGVITKWIAENNINS